MRALVQVEQARNCRERSPNRELKSGQHGANIRNLVSSDNKSLTPGLHILRMMRFQQGPSLVQPAISLDTTTPSTLLFFAAAGSVFLVVLILTITVRHLIIAAPLDAARIREGCRRTRDQIKYLGFLSISISILAAIHKAQGVLLQAAIAGSGLERCVGPLAETLHLLEIGLAVALLALVCMMLVLAQSSRLMAKFEC